MGIFLWTFGKLDSFFAVSSKKRLAIDIEGQAEFVNSETPETEELEVKAKNENIRFLSCYKEIQSRIYCYFRDR